MATWDPPSDVELDVDKPIKAVDLRRIRDLSAAMSEGAAGAPDISSKWVFVEDCYDHSVDGAIAAFESAAFEDGYEYAFSINNLSNTSGGAEVNFQFYRATDAAYTTACVLFTPSGGLNDESMGWVELKNSRLSTKLKAAVGEVAYASSLTLDTGFASTARATAFARLTTAQKVGKVRFSCAVTFDSGVVAMFRRRTL